MFWAFLEILVCYGFESALACTQNFFFVMDIDISYVTLRFYCVPSLDDKNVVVDSSNDAFKSESLLASRTDEEQTYHRSNIL